MVGGSFPDCLVVGKEMLQRGAEDLTAGDAFRLDGAVKSGELRFPMFWLPVAFA